MMISLGVIITQYFVTHKHLFKHNVITPEKKILQLFVTLKYDNVSSFLYRFYNCHGHDLNPCDISFETCCRIFCLFGDVFVSFMTCRENIDTLDTPMDISLRKRYVFLYIYLLSLLDIGSNTS